MFHVINNRKETYYKHVILNYKIVSKMFHTPSSPNQLGLRYNTSNNGRFRVFSGKNVSEFI
jgi:hypothetical protein